MVRHGVARPEQIKLGLFELTLIAVAVIAAAATPLYVVGLARGDHLDSAWPLVMAPLIAAGCAATAYTLATAAPVNTAAPEPVGAPAVLQVSVQLGFVFWLLSGVVAALIMVTAVVVERLPGFSGSGSGTGSSGLIATADSLTTLAFLVGMVLFAAEIPRRILRARGRTLLWLSADGIGYPPVVVGDDGFIAWQRVHQVSYQAVKDSRNVVTYAHRWTIHFDSPSKTRTVEYPAGAIPRPRSIRLAIDELIAGAGAAGD